MRINTMGNSYSMWKNQLHWSHHHKHPWRYLNSMQSWFGRHYHRKITWMSRWKLGSKVRKWVITPTKPPFLGRWNNPLILTSWFSHWFLTSRLSQWPMEKDERVGSCLVEMQNRVSCFCGWFGLGAMNQAGPCGTKIKKSNWKRCKKLTWWLPLSEFGTWQLCIKCCDPFHSDLQSLAS